MKSNFHPNQILYVRGIGYARLAVNGEKSNQNIDLPKSTQITNPNESNQPQNDEGNDSLLFDPDMFNIDADSPFAQSQVQINLAEHNTRKKSMEVSRRPSLTQIKNRQLIIVPLKLEQTNVMIYCPETYLMKKITLNVKSLLQNNRKSIPVSIQITKTIDNLKNQILKDLGQQGGLYSDIRIFATSIRLEELNIGSKTVWQYQLKDKCKICIAAKFNFTFKNLVQGKQQNFVLSNGNSILSQIAAIPKKQQSSIPIANTSTTVATETTTTVINTTIPNNAVVQVNIPQQQIAKVQKQEIKAEQQSKKVVEKQKQPEKQKQLVQQKQKQVQKQKPLQKPLQKLHLQCNAKFRSGIHYWQIKIDKLNSSKQGTSLMVGICLKSEQQSSSQKFIQLWAYDLMRGRKVEICHSTQKQQKQKIQQKTEVKQQQKKQEQQINGSDQSDEEYGSIAKTGDSIGVYLAIKQKNASLVFYKNSICLQECYQFNIDKLKCKQTKDQTYICPFISASGQIQLSLDSKATLPLDSYRFK